ncbi:MAG: cytochrome C [Candidatus Competibacteraceae bacterium]|nr:cytochrome C [Candidatus Competibacteraceae bacterium]
MSDYLKSVLLWCVIAYTPTLIAADTPENSPLTGFSGYPGAPAFTVAPRAEPLPNYPCSMCHQYKPPDPKPRKLAVPHPELDHGKGRLWCMECHDLEDRDQLGTLRGEKVGYDQTYLVCGQCHFPQQKDWFFGAHGKRVGNWQGEREIYNCSQCHDPHAPVILPRAPQLPPPVRAGLERQEGVQHNLPAIWERHTTAKATESTDEQQ